MKEKPIIFQGPMVRAILDGKKCQTRRPLKSQFDPPGFFEKGIREWKFRSCYKDGTTTGTSYFIACPFGRKGDRLWVRETHCILDHHHWWDPSKAKDWMYDVKYPRRNACAYRAECDEYSERCRRDLGYKWRASIHMPRWASRITLEITDVRVQRTQDISLEDIYHEGIDPNPAIYRDDEGHKDLDVDEFTGMFEEAWDAIYAKKGLGWEKNPWVWAIDFRRV